MTDTPPKGPADLTRTIETRDHAVHRDHLPVRAQMAGRGVPVHFWDDHVPVRLTDLLKRMLSEMEVHMKQQELILFPAIRKGGMPDLENPIAVMRADHDDHTTEVAEIRRVTRDLILPDEACGIRTALSTGLTEVLTHLKEHMRLKTDVLFPQFEPS